MSRLFCGEDPLFFIRSNGIKLLTACRHMSRDLSRNGEDSHLARKSPIDLPAARKPAPLSVRDRSINGSGEGRACSTTTCVTCNMITNNCPSSAVRVYRVGGRVCDPGCMFSEIALWSRRAQVGVTWPRLHTRRVDLQIK